MCVIAIIIYVHQSVIISAIVLSRIVNMAAARSAKTAQEHMRNRVSFNGTSLAHAQMSFDVLIEAMPIGIVVQLSRGFHQLWMDKTGKSPWEWGKCIGNVMHQEHFRQGLLVFIRVQHTMANKGSIADAKTFYMAMHEKVITMMDWTCAWLDSHPDASVATADRAMCLLSDMRPVIYEPQLNVVYNASGEVWLTLSCWKPEDSEDAMPIFVFMESAPGSSIQSPPKLLKNKLRPIGCDEACHGLPANGFMLCRDPQIEWTGFVHDTFDERFRRPLVRLINWMATTGAHLDHVDLVIDDDAMDLDALD